MSWEDFGTLGALAVSGANQIPGCTATLSPTGLLTITLPSGDVPGMFTTYMNAALPAMDLSDEGVVYEVTAELVSKPAGLNLMVGQVTATPDTSVNTSVEAVAALNFQTYPAGVTATLAASNVRQRRSNDMAPGNNYERVLARVMAGPNPGIQVQLTSKNDIMVGGDVVIQLRVRRQVASAPAAGNVLHFRDPADGVFKPLTGVSVRGFPCEPTGPQAPSTPALGQWTWGAAASVSAGEIAAPEAISAAGAGSIYIHPTDAGGTDRTATLAAIVAGDVVTLKQGGAVVTAIARGAYFAMLKSLDVTYRTGGPWGFTAGSPVEVWATKP